MGADILDADCLYYSLSIIAAEPETADFLPGALGNYTYLWPQKRTICVRRKRVSVLRITLYVDHILECLILYNKLEQLREMKYLGVLNDYIKSICNLLIEHFQQE